MNKLEMKSSQSEKLRMDFTNVFRKEVVRQWKNAINILTKGEFENSVIGALSKLMIQGNGHRNGTTFGIIWR